MMINIVSWNTQGDGIRKISDSCGDFFTSGAASILLLQEAGSVCKTYGQTFTTPFGRHNMIGYFAEQDNVDNLRCTTGIFAENTLTGSFEQQNQIAKRPIICLNLFAATGNYIIATIHATANHHVAANELLTACQFLNHIYAGKSGWLLMGDFNCEPSELISKGIPATNIAASGKATQQSGSQLDYAVFSNSLIGRVAVNFGVPNGSGSVPLSSDHYPVYCTLNL